MTTVAHNKKQLTSREFFRSPAKVTALVAHGNHIVVTNRGEAVFEVMPARPVVPTMLRDLADLQFSAKGDADLSKRVDEIVYA